MKTKRKRERLSARAWVKAADRLIPKAGGIEVAHLENNLIFDPGLGFNRKAPGAVALDGIAAEFARMLDDGPIPTGLTRPIAAGPKREPVSRRNIEALTANLLRMHKKGKKTMSISLYRNDYGGTKLSAGVINAVKLAAHPSRQLLVLKAGFRDMQDPKKSRRARVKPTRKFRDLLDTLIVRDDAFAAEPADLIGLRRTVRRGGQRRKEWVPRDEWEPGLPRSAAERLDGLKADLEWWNRVYAEFEITYVRAADDERHYLNPILYSVYSEGFDRGGRFYTGVGGHQNLAKSERRTIRFDGRPSVELDFGGLHVRMLYHLNGCDYPLDADPYAAVLDALGIDPGEAFAESPKLRDDLKTMLLALVNGEATKRQAVARAHYRLFHSWRRESGDLRESGEQEAAARKERWADAGLRPDKDGVGVVLRAFRKAHRPIRDRFSSGCGLHLQNLDAEIARLVLNAMMPRSGSVTPVLPVHDSFVAASDVRSELKNAMSAAYRDVMRGVTGRNGSFRIPVKRG